MKISVTLGVLIAGFSPLWVSQGYSTIKSIGDNKTAIAANSEAITELAETLGGMEQLFGNAEIMPVGDSLTASVNIHSDAVRWSQVGRRLTVTNTGDKREMSVTVTVEGKFEGEPHLFLNLSAAAGRAVGAPPRRPEDENQEPVEIQIAVELFREKKADD